jgi:Putative lipoprotein LpqV
VARGRRRGRRVDGGGLLDRPREGRAIVAGAIRQARLEPSLAARRRRCVARRRDNQISVPAKSTEGGYFQACHAAKVWMQVWPGDRRAQVEPYLATVQAPGTAGAGTWNTAWTDLTSARQAAVIVAVRAAAKRRVRLTPGRH